MKKNCCFFGERNIPWLIKFLRFMKLTIFLLLISVVSVLASKTYSQTKNLSINMDKATVKEVLENIEEQSEFYFMYSEKVIDVNRKVSVDINNEKIGATLNRLFDGTNVDYTIKDRIIVLTTPEVFSEKSKAEIQQKSVSGYVTDESGEPLPGVTVVIKGTTQGTVTNADGNFTLTNIPDNATLLFSFVGMQTQEVVVGDQGTINVVMKFDAVALEEVVAIGYGVVKKRDLTGSLGQIKAEVLNELPVAGFDQAMQGKVSGVRVINSNAAPGGGFDIQIRGVGSLTSSSQPLVVIDGMPLLDENYQAENNPMNLVNPNDIESIEVLKDASSAAIYGARAAGGVILITTKKGKSGKPTFNFNVSHGMSQSINIPEMGSTDQWFQWHQDMRNHLYIKHDPGNYVPSVDASWKWDVETEADLLIRSQNLIDLRLISNSARAFDFLAFDSNVHKDYQISQIYDLLNGTAYWRNTETNWVDEVQRDGTFPGSINQYNLSANGGTDKARYFISGGYYDEEGIVKTSDYRRLTFQVKLDVDVTDWLTVGTQLSPSWQDMGNIGGNRVENRWFASPFYQTALYMAPILKPYDDDGNIMDYGSTSYWNEVEQSWYGPGAFVQNPLFEFERTDRRTTFRNLGNFYAQVKLLKDFTLKSSILTDYSHRQQREWIPSTYASRFNSPGPDRLENDVQAMNQQSRLFKYYWENSLSYSKTIADKHNFTAIGVFTKEETSSDLVIVRKKGFTTDAIDRPAGGTVVNDPLTDATDRASKDAFVGILGRVQYNYDGKYYLTGSFRRDGSSRFGENTLWGNFPSLAVAWRMSDESFMDGFNFLNDLKWRFSYGVTGNSSIPRGRQQPIYAVNSYVIGGSIASGFALNNLFDPNLGWEKTEEYNYGVDVSFFDGRLGFTGDIYSRTTKDMLLQLDLPQYVGYSSVLTNFGEMENKGWEFSVNATPVSKSDLLWQMDFNVSHNRNKITRLYPEEQVPILGANVGGLNATRAYVGGPTSLFWGTVQNGIYNDWDEVINNPAAYRYNADLSTLRRSSSAPGEIRYEDVDGDGVITGNDVTVIGSPWPDAFWGFSNTLRYKGFDLYVQLDGTIGAEVYNMTKFEVYRQAMRNFNLPASHLSDYWTPDNPDAKYPIIPKWSQTNDANWQGTFIKEDGDFTAIRTIRLGYTLPKTLVKKIGISKLRIYTTVQNALYFTKYEGLNPEGNNRGSSSGDSSNNYGVDGGNYPISRTITTGIDLTF